MAGPQAVTHLRNLNDTGQNVTAGIARITHIHAINTSGATAFVQVFDLAVASVTLGTTRPLISIPLAATTGIQSISFSPAIGFMTRVSVFSTTTVEGSTGSADGVYLQAWIE